MTEQLPLARGALCIGDPEFELPAGIQAVSSVSAALDAVASGRFAVVVLMPQPDATLESLSGRVRDVCPTTTVISMDDLGSTGGSEAGPTLLDQLVAWGRQRHRAAIETSVRQLGGAPAGEAACRAQDELVGGGEAMSGFRSRLRQVAEHDVPTLIHGPCGTPLDAAARWLHDSSIRREGPFVPIDCRGGTASQLLMRIFGHAAGAFPGASEPGPSAIGLAAGGTLLLDGIDNASEQVQLRLVELLRDGHWAAVGSDVPRVGQTRVVITLRQAPLQALVEGTLRRTLMDRVSGHIVRMPSLQDRAEDLPDLICHHITQSAARLGRPRPELDQDLLSVLVAAKWPGHDRELELVCERLVLHATTRSLDPSTLAGWVEASSGGEGRRGMICDGGRTLADLERTAILATLRHHKGHRRRSAAALGIGVRTLGLKLRRWKDAAIVPETL
ncbi:MAG: sigma 54-interacting transcriptional regulator [Phycisphaerales bacterium]|jgi:DNA-binding NtrC family response regulator|nr:sigma 54-interacting transcriptional regulator [Phycisphaerales bacterium]